jgi:hypothetical protein
MLNLLIPVDSGFPTTHVKGYMKRLDGLLNGWIFRYLFHETKKLPL